MEYEPLFSPGFYDVPFCGFDQHLTRLLVEPFTNQMRRKELLSHLSDLLQTLETVGNAGGIRTIVEVWVNGSFVTRKESPGDVDIVVWFETSTFFSPEQRKRIDRNVWKERGCEVEYYECNNPTAREHFEELFGTDRNGNRKGIVRIRFQERGDGQY